jgi:hypothetical protein
MDQDANKPDERPVSQATEGEVKSWDVDLSLFLDPNSPRAECEAKAPTNLPCSHIDASPYNDEHVLFDECGDENLSSQVAMLESSVELTGGVTVYEIPDDKPAPPEPVVAVETPSLIQCIARLFFGGSR